MKLSSPSKRSFLASLGRAGLALLLALFVLAGPRARAAEPFFFIQLSDTQLGMFTDNGDFTQDAANFEFAVAAVNRLRPAFVIVTGDLVNKAGDAEQIAAYRRILAKIDKAIPVYSLSGNHDVENVPTLETIAAYTKIFGPDRYTFSHQGLTGIVLNSSLIHSPDKAPQLLAEQDQWLRTELQRAKDSGAQHIVIFQHHPWFLKSADEPDQYFNIPLARRAKLLALFREFGVRYLFCGHYHRNAEAADGPLNAITTGAVGKPLDGSKSGFRVAIVRDDKIEHRFYDLGDLPTRIDLKPAAEKPAPPK
jgi:3',5'-cyclic AMP phosphodiesterase CpdA